MCVCVRVYVRVYVCEHAYPGMRECDLHCVALITKTCVSHTHTYTPAYPATHTRAQVKPVDERLRGLSATAKLVLDVVQFDPALQRAVQYAVGNAVVCETEEECKHLCFGSRVRL